MAFKIEMRILNITNYPSVAKHLEDMASKGWLIKKIISNSIFIYKRIEPEELDFGITPYEVETTFTSKTKEELKEFQSVCEMVGWNYAAKSNDFHIYFKEKGTDVIDLETDEEEEFKSMERIGNKFIIVNVLMILFISFPTYFIWMGRFSGVVLMRDGLIQGAALLFPIVILLSIIQIYKIKRFLKGNKENIESGEKIEYKNSRHYFEKMVYLLFFIVTLLLVFYGVYVGFILKNTQMLMAFVAIVLGGAIGLSGKLARSAKISSSSKVIIFGLGIIAAVIMSFIIAVIRTDKIIQNYNDLNVKNYKVLTSDVFDDDEKIINELDNKLFQEVSFLVPKSYEYAYYTKENKQVRTGYSNVLNEEWAKTLVKEYVKQGQEQLERYEYRLGFLLQEDDYYSKDEENLWNLDEVYFLNRGKTEIVIRDGKEVFYLEGKDFSDPDIIKIVKYKLGL